MSGGIRESSEWEVHKGIETERGPLAAAYLPYQNSKYPALGARRTIPSVPVAGSKSATPRKSSHAASVIAGSAPTRSRIICQAATLSAPSGAGPIASETEHCGQKQILRAADFCRGRTPTVWANIYTATDLCPDSSDRLQRRQNKFSKIEVLCAQNNILSGVR
jgi:hypothetical protein